MSNVKGTQSEETFTSKLDIQMVSTSTYEALIDMAASTPKAVVTAIGPSGIGKSAIPRQVAKKRGAPYVPLHMPTMSVEDFHIPTTASDTKQFYDRRIPRKFQELIEFCKKVRAENGGEFPHGMNPILAIEELNRTVDKHVTRATFTLLDDRMIGDTHLDEAIQMVVTMNPAGGGMAVNEFEKDPAMRRRLVMVGVSCSYKDFMRYAQKQNFHPKVLEHISAQPTMLYDGEGAMSGKKFACPAAWDTVSQVCIALEKAEYNLDSHEARAAIAGTIGATATEVFLEFVKDSTTVITPDEVLSDYKENSPVRARFKKLLEESRMDKVSALTSGVVMKLLSDTKRKFDTYGKQLALFMDDMPEESMVAFIRELYEEGKHQGDGHKFVLELNQKIAKEPYFNTALERLQRAQTKASKEAKKSGF